MKQYIKDYFYCVWLLSVFCVGVFVGIAPPMLSVAILAHCPTLLGVALAFGILILWFAWVSMGGYQFLDNLD